MNVRYKVEAESIRAKWSRTGFILVAIGSAVGLGNLWRFPYIVGESGGGGFLLPFSIAFLLFAIPMMMMEFAAGRHYRKSVMGTLGSMRSRLRLLGLLPVIITLGVFSYYLVITGWVLGYLVFSITGYIDFRTFTSSYLPVLFFLCTLLITGFIVQFDVKTGIERVNRYLLPLLFVFLVVLLIKALTLPGVEEGIAYYLTIDFCSLSSPRIWVLAFGQAFFSLGVGYGILLTYGSYMLEDTDIPVSSGIIALADFLVAFTAGFIIFPIVFSYGFSPASGPELAFITLPAIFSNIFLGEILGPIFFLLLFIGAISSTISMMELGTATLTEEIHISRKFAVALLMGILILIGLPSAISYAGTGLELAGLPFLDFMDLIFGTIFVPLVAAILCLAISWSIPREKLLGEINQYSRFPLPGALIYMLRYIIPAILIGILAFDTFSLFTGTGFTTGEFFCPFSTLLP